MNRVHVVRAACAGAAVALVCAARGAGGEAGPGLDAELRVSLQPESAAPPPPPVEHDTPFLSAWHGKVELGLNGSAGNSESLNVRGVLGLERKTDELDTRLWANYSYATSEGDKDKSRGELGGRNDWMFKESAWLVFADALVEYDEFQAWDWRVSGHAGLGYAFIKDEKTTLLGRAGLGFNQTLGGPDEKFTPEGLLGIDASHQLTARQRISGSVDYLPSLRHFPEFRLVAKVGWEILVDPETKMSLKIGAEDRYDSTPGDDAKKNDIDYFAMLVWSF